MNIRITHTNTLLLFLRIVLFRAPVAIDFIATVSYLSMCLAITIALRIYFVRLDRTRTHRKKTCQILATVP